MAISQRSGVILAEEGNEMPSLLNNSLNETQYRNETWWQRRSRLERRPSLCALLLAFVAFALAIVTTIMVYDKQHPQSPSNMITNSTTTQDKGGMTDCVCDTSGCVLAAAEILQNMDKSVDPCQDFYAFACGGIEKKFIPEDSTQLDLHSVINDKVNQQLRSLVEKPIKEEEAEPFKLAKMFYRSCINKTRAEEVGLDPLAQILSEFGGWPVVVGDTWNEDNFDWIETIIKCRQIGYAKDYLMDFSISTDLENSTCRSIFLNEANLGMPIMEHLFNGLEDKYVKAYLNYQVGIATLLGADRDKAIKEQTLALLFEIELAKMKLPVEDRFNIDKLYNPMTIKELIEKVPQIPWLTYMNTMLAPHHVVTEDERVIVEVPDYFPKLVDLIAKTPKRTIANYLMWRISSQSAAYLNDAANDAQLKCSSVLFGNSKRKPRWEECLMFMSLGNAVGAMYVREYFDESARKSANEMVKDIRDVFNEIIDELDWMDDKTRIRAKEKAAAITIHIAYPDELLDDKKLTELYTNLTFDSSNFLSNVLSSNRYDRDYEFKKLREPVNKKDWVSHGYPTVVNAFYSFTENSMEFPAGILQGAFFAKDRPAYLNYGAIGQVIGHELTHGFDNYGCKFGPDGNLAEWWEPETKKQFLEKAQCIIDQYGNYSVPDLGLHVNGFNTQGENIADNGGIKESYRAYIKWANRQKKGSENWDQVEARLPGLAEFNIRQLFWIAAAYAKCEKYLPEGLKDLILTGQHSPARFRVNGALSNMPEFASDFHCPLNTEMNPAKKCTVW